MNELRRLLYPAITITGLIAFVMGSPRYPELTGWSVLFVFATSFGALMWMRTRRISRWFVSSVPWWVMSNSSGWFEFGAAMLTLCGLIALATGPTLPGRRRVRRKEVPLPHLASGPLTAVVARTYPTAKPSRALQVVTIVMFCLTCALAIAAALGAAVEIGALALAGLIITLTFAFSNWFSGRVRVRIDDRGLHSRVLFAEQTIPWNEIAGMTLRHVFFPGTGVRINYYVVFSATHEFNFASSIAGAKELQAAIEAATGMTFPEPQIAANF